MKLIVCIAVIFIPFVLSDDYRRGDHHFNSIVENGSFTGACRKKHPENRDLPGGAAACHSHKPLKVKGLQKVGKRICGEGYEYCSMSHKSLHHLSWKTEAMPKSCFAFHYKKDKFAGYGHNCHRNLYFDGLLCCPKTSNKTAQKLRIGSSNSKLHHNNHKHNYVNFVKK